jgi:hypothetical protein
MKIRTFLLAPLWAFFFTCPALAQNAGTVTNHAFALGKGPGVTGYTSLLCTSAQLAVGQAAADPICQTVTGDVTISAGGVTAIGANKVTNAQIRQSGALSLIGRSANSTGNVADISATPASSCVFLESASTLTCALIGTANISAAAVTYAKMQNVTAARLLGNPTGGAAAPSEISLGATLTFSGAALQTIAMTGDVTSSANAFATTIAANAVTNAKMATMATNTVKGNATSGSAVPTDLAVPSCSTASSAITWTTNTGFGCNSIAGGSSLPGTPGGRLTPSSGTCAPTTDASAVTSIFYAPCVSPYIQIYNGSSPQLYNFTASVTDTVGLTLTLGSNWAASTLFDAFIALNAGSPVICTVAWSSSAAGTSARTTALALYTGMQTNGAAIGACRINNTTTIAVAQYQGTYVGTFLTNGSAGQVDFKFGGSAAGGSPAVAGVWNMYNRTPGAFYVNDTTVNFGTSATSTYQPLDVGGPGSGLNNRVTFITGTGTDPIDGKITLGGQPASGTQEFGLGLNVTNAINTRCVSALTGNTAAGIIMTVPCNVYAPLGLNYLQGIQWSTNNASPFISGKYGAITATWWW